MGFISATLGRFSPRHRTLDQWTPIYAQPAERLYNKNRGKANPSDKWKSVPLPGAAHKLPVAFDSDTLSQNLKERP